MKRTAGVTAIAVGLLLAGCGPDEAAEPETVQVPELILPPGFSAEVVFEGTGESRELFIRSDGDLFVSLSGLRDDDHILGLRDENGDHVIDTVAPFYRLATPAEQKVPRVHIAYHDDYLYAVNNEQVVRMLLPAGQLNPVGDVEVVVERIPYQSSHRGRTLVDQFLSCGPLPRTLSRRRLRCAERIVEPRAVAPGWLHRRVRTLSRR